MKLVLSLAPFVNSQRGADRDNVPELKRFGQLVDMMTHINPDFDSQKYWMYGCNCQLTGDKPMSQPGLGKPVDELDSVCKTYKDCLKCARRQFGDGCLAEFVRYDFSTGRGQLQCEDRLGTCHRAICACDRQFAEAHEQTAQVFSLDFHMLLGGWDPNSQCMRNVARPDTADLQCCADSNQAFVSVDVLHTMNL